MSAVRQCVDTCMRLWRHPRTGRPHVAPRFALAAVGIALATTLAAPGFAYAQGIASTPADPAELVDNAMSLDGTEVTLVGEAIGDRLHSGQGHVWINVLGEQGVAVGVWVDKPDTEAVETYGDYTHVGDTVLVTGVLNIACEAHGGDFDVHAATCEVVQAGTTIDRPADPAWAILGAIGIAAAIVLQRVRVGRRLRVPFSSTRI